MQIVTIDSNYINYLWNFDKRVAYNKDKAYSRPYVGVLFTIKGLLYFAPLTSSGKGKKLKQAPKSESLTFYPINGCKYGGINFNNMIPVLPDVYSKVNMALDPNDSKEERQYKFLLINQIKFLTPQKQYLKVKALKLYSMKNNNQLYSNYDEITCNFKLLEEKSLLYKS